MIKPRWVLRDYNKAQASNFVSISWWCIPSSCKKCLRNVINSDAWEVHNPFLITLHNLDLKTCYKMNSCNSYGSCNQSQDTSLYWETQIIWCWLLLLYRCWVSYTGQIFQPISIIFNKTKPNQFYQTNPTQPNWTHQHNQTWKILTLFVA